MSYKARIKFDNREWLVVDTIIFEDIKYLYIVQDISDELKKLEKPENFQGNLCIEFIYKLDNGNYKNVIDNELFKKLSNIVADRALKE